MHDSPRAREKQQPWARPCDQHFVVLEGTTGVGFDVELLGRAVFFKRQNQFSNQERLNAK